MTWLDLEAEIAEEFAGLVSTRLEFSERDRFRVFRRAPVVERPARVCPIAVRRARRVSTVFADAIVDPATIHPNRIRELARARGLTDPREVWIASGKDFTLGQIREWLAGRICA